MSDTDYNRRFIQVTTSPVIAENAKTILSIKSRKKLKKQLNRLILVITWNVTLAALPLSPSKITNHTLETTPNAD